MQQDNSEQVIIDPVLIAKHYIRTWFFLDLLSSIPLDYIFLIFNAGKGDVSIFLDMSYFLFLTFEKVTLAQAFYALILHMSSE